MRFWQAFREFLIYLGANCYMSELKNSSHRVNRCHALRKYKVALQWHQTHNDNIYAVHFLKAFFSKSFMFQRSKLSGPTPRNRLLTKQFTLFVIKNTGLRNSTLCLYQTRSFSRTIQKLLKLHIEPRRNVY